MDIITMMVPLILLAGVSLAIGMSKKGFDVISFIGSLAIGISIFIWSDILPEYLVVMPMMIIGILFFIRGEDNE